MSKALTIDQLETIVKNQLLYEKNIECRSNKEIIKELPFKALKSFSLTTGLGTTMTFGSSLFVFRNFKIVKSDIQEVLPVLSMFSTIDFTINYTLTKSLGKIRPERWICCTSGATSGAITGWYFGKSWKPTLFGGICGGIYGSIRNYPLELFGYEPF